ncbi:HNH endonuclease [Cystobacter fuscus]|nr:hypothetical protein [Cystobacter fuscus]
MIRIDRGAEPRGLKIAAPKRLRAAAKVFNRRGALSKALTKKLTGYGTEKTKQALFLAQHEKCAWCERHTDFSSAPVEHYRPKDGAWRHLPKATMKHVDQGHYWWLTWTWSNLLFSCARCNDRAHKANYFPLRPTTVPAAVPTAPLPRPLPSPIVDVSGEQALLLDPAGSEDPLDHITWRPGFTHLHRREWIWSPFGLTEKGEATIEILKLEELAGRAQGHVIDALLPSIEEVEQHLGASRVLQARQRWQRFLEDSLSPRAEWTAFTWHALAYLVPVAYRLQHGLAVPPRPGAP